MKQTIDQDIGQVFYTLSGKLTQKVKGSQVVEVKTDPVQAIRGNPLQSVNSLCVALAGSRQDILQMLGALTANHREKRSPTRYFGI